MIDPVPDKVNILLVDDQQAKLLSHEVGAGSAQPGAERTRRDAGRRQACDHCGGREQARGGPDSRLPLGEYLRISIADTGVGMNEQTLAKATDPFFTTKGPGKGTGLGLSMVHGLAAQSGGLLRIDSAPSVGTSVQLWLPRATTLPAGAMRNVECLRPSPTTSKPCRVLIVDDDPLVLTGTAALIEDLGHTTIEAHSGAEALSVLAAGTQVDIVITDHAMPNMTGLQLVQILHERYPGVPIILSTGFAELPGDPAKLGILKLAKPCTQHDIAVAIQTAFDSREPRQAYA